VVVDVVLLEGEAAAAVAEDLAVRPPAATAPAYLATSWLAVASAGGAVLGAALGRRGPAGFDLLALRVFTGAGTGSDQAAVADRLLAALGPLRTTR
jgi:hypothetical protein